MFSLDKARALLGACAVLIGIGLVGCGGGGGGGDDDGGGGGGGTGRVAGTVFAPDGSTPVSGARVRVPSVVPASRVPDTLTGADGSFLLQEVPTGNQTVRITKGEWTKDFTINVSEGQTSNAPSSATTLPATGAGAAKIAVVTGSYDRMQDVLAKLGLGDVDGQGQLVPGSEEFTLVDGDDTLSDTTYDNLDEFLADQTDLNTYDIVFVNCGADTTAFSGSTSEVVALRNYVNGGGKLFVTDLSAPVVEAAFPAGINFLGNDSTPTASEEDVSAAMVGTSGITTDATPNNNLADWLDERGALQQNGTVHIEGFLSGWVVMNGVGNGGTVWVQGPVEWEDFSAASKSRAPHSHSHEPATRSLSRASGVRPLTVTFNQGQGRVLYSSYHTEETPSTTLRPQEQILAYLVFEL